MLCIYMFLIKGIHFVFLQMPIQAKHTNKNSTSGIFDALKNCARRYWCVSNQAPNILTATDQSW